MFAVPIEKDVNLYVTSLGKRISICHVKARARIHSWFAAFCLKTEKL